MEAEGDYIQSCQVASRLGVPQFDEVVFTSRGEKRFLRMPVNTFDIPSVSCQSSLFDSLVKVPDLDGAVV